MPALVPGMCARVCLCKTERQSRLALRLLTMFNQVETEHFIDASQYNKSTVGLMVGDGIVTNMLAGAPACVSKKFKKGDK